MPKVDLIATRDFTYNTRRLKAGDDFQARNRDDAKILIELLGKARMGRPKAEVEAPPEDVMERVKEVVAPRILTTEEVLKAEVVKEKPQLDHDGNGRAGGSAKGAASTRRRGAAKRKAKTKN